LLTLIKTLIKSLIFSNILVALCATALTHQSYILLKIPLKTNVLLFVFSSTFIIYNAQRLIRLKNILPTKDNERFLWINKNKTLLLLSSVVSGIIALISLYYFNINAVYFLVPLCILSIIYVIPIIPFNNQLIPLRSIPYIKVFTIAFVWAAITTILPLFNSNQPFYFSNNLILLTIEQFLFIVAITLPFDIRDLDFDKKQNVRTIPALIGVKNTIRLAEGLLIVFLALKIQDFYLFETLSSPKLISFILTTAITMTIVRFSTKKRSELFYSGWIESTMLIQYLGVLLF